MLADEKEIMLKSQRQLRFVQVTCILVVVACIVIVYIRIHDNAPSPTTLGFGQVIIILLALWSGVSGFMMQRRFQRRNTTSQKSTSFTRWRAGHIMRLWSATAVGIWALVLYNFHGPLWIADLLFGVGILLLLIWRPDAAPEAKDSVFAGSGQ
jgi:hypothetical protein